jgi:hypothetical protein
MKRLLIAAALALGLVVTLAGNPMDSPAYATQSYAQYEQFGSQFVAMDNFNPAPMVADTGPGAYSFVSAVAFDQYSATCYASETAIEAAVYYYSDTGAQNKMATFKLSSSVVGDIEKVATTTSSTAPSQPDHPAADNAFAEGFGEQACVKKKFSGGSVLRT